MGRSGYFYEFCKQSKADQLAGKKLSVMDRRLHFFPWWREPTYQLWDDCIIDKEMQEYFREIQTTERMTLSDSQKWWYIKKSRENGDEMKSEFPSTFDESFWVSNQALYYHKEITKLREKKQICAVPYDPSLPVYNNWDLGHNDFNVIFYWQVTRDGQIRFIDCDIGNHESLIYWVGQCRAKPYQYGDWFFPADINHVDYGFGINRMDILDQLGVKYTPVPFEKVEDGIQMVKAKLSQCWFDEVKCAKALVYIENYRKKYNEKFDYYSGPVDDDNAHAADCLRYSIASALTVSSGTGMSAEDLFAMRNRGVKKSNLGWPFG